MPPPRMIAERYEILSEIGRGGMGLVARAFDHRLQTEVALKILRRDLTLDVAQTDSLVKEARILARLTHPSVVRLFDLAETEFGLMLILEYVRGPNLAQVLKARSRLTETELLFIMRQICSGLDAAHAEGIVHRDLKPPNLLVAADSDSFESFKKGVCTSSFLLDAKVKITDFGISKLLASRADVNSGAVAGDGTWSSAGTPLFMSPEQFQGQPSTPETDIYALGVVCYQALSGALPFAGDSVEALAQKHISEAPKPIADCSPRINSAILRAMAKRPEDRYSSARAFLAALEGTAEPSGISSNWQPAPTRSNVLPLSLLCGTLVVLVIVTVFFLARSPRHQNTAPNYSLIQPAPPDLGKRLTLPEDMDLLPEISSPPMPSPVPAATPALPGPHRPRISWTALIDTDEELEPWVDGVGPDGTIYVRDEIRHTLWAIDDGDLRWAYRASKQGGIDALIDRDSHVDFHDPGRIWLAWCPDDIWHPRSRCSGAVFNATGAGGHISRLPAGIGLRRTALNITYPFSETDAQNARWPEDEPSLLSASHLSTVTLTDRDKHWSLPLDGRAAFAIDHGNGFIVSTTNGAIYALNHTGQIQWTYKVADAPENLQILPSGDLVVLEKDRQTLTCIRVGKLRWKYHSADLIEEFEDHVAGTIRRLAVADKDSTLYVLISAGSAATMALDRDGKLLWNLPWAGSVNSGALTLDLHGRLFFTFALYEIDHRSRGGLICISDK